MRTTGSGTRWELAALCLLAASGTRGGQFCLTLSLPQALSPSDQCRVSGSCSQIGVLPPAAARGLLVGLESLSPSIPAQGRVVAFPLTSQLTDLTGQMDTSTFITQNEKAGAKDE